MSREPTLTEWWAASGWNLGWTIPLSSCHCLNHNNKKKKFHTDICCHVRDWESWPTCIWDPAWSSSCSHPRPTLSSVYETNSLLHFLKLLWLRLISFTYSDSGPYVKIQEKTCFTFCFFLSVTLTPSTDTMMPTFFFLMFFALNSYWNTAEQDHPIRMQHTVGMVWWKTEMALKTF